MMRLVILLCGLLAVIPVQAQDSATAYRLRIPPVETFIAAVTPIADAARAQDMARDPLSYQAEADATVWLRSYFDLHYDAEADAETLFAFYSLLEARGRNLAYTLYQSFVDAPSWNRRIVARWLRDHPTDLAAADALEFIDYRLRISRHNFDGAPPKELVVEVENDTYRGYWLAEPADDAPGGYTFTTVPLPERINGYWPAYEQWGGAYTLAIEDINADGRDEWIARTYIALPGSSYIGGMTYLYVLGWKADGLELLARVPASERYVGADADAYVPPESYEVREPIWEFGDLDGDPAQEIVQTSYHLDNWGCERFVRRVFDWDGAYYEAGQQAETRALSVNCALREAEIHMAAGDYGRAVPFYAQAIARYDDNFVVRDDEMDSLAQYAAYAQERLVVALALDGQIDAAFDALQTLRGHRLLAGTIAEALLAIPRDRFNAATVCQTAHDALVAHQARQDPAAPKQYRNLRLIGHVVEDIFLRTEVSRTGGVNPARAGCDPDALARRFAPAATPTPAPTPDAMPSATPDEAQRMTMQFAEAMQQIERASFLDDQAMILARSAEALRLAETLATDPAAIAEIRHYRAHAYLRLGRDDDALAEYLAIVRDAPETHWAMLAALFLEPLP